MSFITEIADIFGIRSTPWVIRVYLVLVAVCIGVMVFALGHVPDGAGPEQPAAKVLALAMDSFKIVLGAVIGALSMAAQHRWGSAPANEGSHE
jgi:hypothetical protein